MAILGISCSPRKEKFTSHLVRIILDAAGGESGFVSLAEMEIRPCTGCLACTLDNVCNVPDDFAELQAKVLGAEALVIGAPNYFGGVNALAHCFLERLYAFRHQGIKLKGKPVVLAVVGSMQPEAAMKDLERFAGWNGMEIVARVLLPTKSPPCLVCGFGADCPESVARLIYGEGFTRDRARIPKWEDMVEIHAAARKAGAALRARLGK